jgi:aminoglycoside phosphotransferase (APT) family kinase protein
MWRVQSGDRAFALRVFRAHEAHVQRRELDVIRIVQAAGVPVSRIMAAGTHEERPALLLEWCAGLPVADALQARPWDVVRVGRAFGRVQAAIHALRAPDSLRQSWIDWPNPAEPALAARLRSLQHGTHRLLHLDYHPLNVLAERGRITAVLDWTNAHAGDPRADAARTVSILRCMPPDLDPVRRAFVLLLELAWRSGYGPLGPDMAPFYAWAGAALLHDVARLYSPAQLEPVRRWTDAWRRVSRLP